MKKKKLNGMILLGSSILLTGCRLKTQDSISETINDEPNMEIGNDVEEELEYFSAPDNNVVKETPMLENQETIMEIEEQENNQETDNSKQAKNIITPMLLNEQGKNALI